MTLQVQGGWLDGNFIRKARKPVRCQYFKGRANGGVCQKPITAGDFYVEGEFTDGYAIGRNGVMLRDKYCPDCGGAEVLATIALIGC